MAIITISRGSLSGGKKLAKCLSERLGYPTLGREVLQEAAESMGVSEEIFRGKFEAAPGFWARLTHERERYTLALQTALAEWCTRGDLVYHGLSGQFLLRDLPGVLRVRLVAPLEMRTKALQDTHPLMTPSQAEQFIQHVDQERSRWSQLIYGEDVRDPSHYDLTINLRMLTLESACAVIAEAVAQPRFQITDEVEEELFAFAAGCRERLSRATGA